MRVKIRKIGGEWKVLHTRDGSTIHNHEPSADIRVHVAHRQRAELLKKAKEIVAKGQPRTECTGRFRNVHWRPCIHELVGAVISCTRLLPRHFDRHGWLRPRAFEYETRRVLVPAVRGTRQRADPGPVRHEANHGISSTRRLPSYEERVDLNHPAQLHHPLTNAVRAASDFGLTDSDDEIDYDDIGEYVES
jgi:hypothetical protein